MIKLTNEQQLCIDKIVKLFKSGEQVVSLTGRAGTGKTTIIDYIIKELKVSSPEFVAYTGKAALVMRRKGNPRARTIHSLIYDVYQDPSSGKLYSTLKRELDTFTDLIVVDEASMCSESIMDDLKSFHVPILLVGDPAQVPPVEGIMNQYMRNPDCHLETILRQALDSGIIAFADQIYSRRDLYYRGDHPDVRAHSANEMTLGMLDWADQVLCGTNSVKDSINQQMRAYKGFTSDLPEVGDKMMCLKNYNLEGSDGTQLVNGLIGYLDYVGEPQGMDTMSPYCEAVLSADFDRSVKFNVRIDLGPFLGNAPHVNLGDPRFDRHHLDFAYAITVHKSQGSEWDNVVVYSNDFFGDIVKLGYTAATRAAKKLVWIQ